MQAQVNIKIIKKSLTLIKILETPYNNHITETKEYICFCCLLNENNKLKIFDDTS